MPVALYALLLDICGISYTILQRTIASCHKNNHELDVIANGQKRKGILSVILYTSAIPLSYVNPYISVAIFFAVAIYWLVPDKNIEKVLDKE